MKTLEVMAGKKTVRYGPILGGGMYIGKWGIQADDVAPLFSGNYNTEKLDSASDPLFVQKSSENTFIPSKDGHRPADKVATVRSVDDVVHFQDYAFSQEAWNTLAEFARTRSRPSY